MRFLVGALTLLAACDVPVVTPFTGMGDHEVDPFDWQLAEPPAFRGEGARYMVGWQVGYAACPSGIAVSPDGGEITFGAWHTVVTTSLSSPTELKDWGFEAHEYVSSIVADGQGDASVLVTQAYYGGGDAFLLHPADDRRESLAEDAYIHDAAVGPGGTVAVTSPTGDVRRCAVEIGDASVRLGAASCWVSDLEAGEPGVAWGTDGSELWRATADGVEPLDVWTSILAWQPDALRLVASVTHPLTGAQSLVGLDDTGHRVWSRDLPATSWVSDIESTADGQVAILATSTGSRVEFRDAADGTISRPGLQLAGWASEMAISADGRTLALILDDSVHVFRLE